MNETPRITVRTYKEGLLSRLAHDLRLTVGRFQVDLTDGSVTATLDATSLRVDGAVRKGELAPDVLSESDRATIERTLASEVLHSAAHPDIVFRGTLQAEEGGRVVAKGTLRLSGRDQPLDLPVMLGEHASIRVEIAPSRWGIAPFRAMAGALKVQDRVGITIELPVNADRSTPWHSWRCHWSSG